jgi:asparagine synthase (glutamine-hydrolysing)
MEKKLLQKIYSYIRLLALGLAHPKVARTIRKVKRENLTYLNYHELLNLTNIAQQLEINNIPGVFIEAGCALGGSAIALASAKSTNRLFYIFDTFEMIPPPSLADGEDAHQRYRVIELRQSPGIGSMPYYGYIDNLINVVDESFTKFGYSTKDNNIRLVKGLFEKTMFIEGPVALAHLDCDWYDSVMICLERIVPHLVVDGVLIIDDYYHWSGSKKAVDDYFNSELRKKFHFTHSSHLVITRIK